MKTNLILATDAYKLTHHLQYPTELNKLYSYAEARIGGRHKTISWFGLQAIIMNNFLEPITLDDINEAEMQSESTFGTKKYFNRDVWEKVLKLGYLPIKIKSLPEGMEVPEGTPLFTIESTESWFATTVNALETLLMQVWYPTTIATNSLYIKKDLYPIYQKSSDLQGEQLDFAIEIAVNDFGLRGATSLESAALGGMAHLLHFRGSDNMIANKLIRDTYFMQNRALSVWATEHSVATSFGGNLGEMNYLKSQLERADDDAIISIVVDSYDSFNFIEQIVATPEIATKIKRRTGRVVFRPDSGIPSEQVLGILNRLEVIFGTTLNTKGYKVLNHNVGVIQGDGMHRESIKDLYAFILNHQYSADNLIVGSGGGLLQQSFNRDVQRFAIKASYAEINHLPVNIQKNPKTDRSKASKSGLLKVIQDQENNLITLSFNDPQGEDLLKTVYENGIFFKDHFSNIVNRAKQNFMYK